jgi:hypothetical protein
MPSRSPRRRRKDRFDTIGRPPYDFETFSASTTRVPDCSASATVIDTVPTARLRSR